MANIKSAKKRIKTIEAARLRNKKVKSSINTNIKKFTALVASKSKEDAKNLYGSLISQLDNALAKGVYHKNNVAHKKSALTKLVNTI